MFFAICCCCIAGLLLNLGLVMAKYVNGPRSAVQVLPAVSYNAGDVIVKSGLTYVADCDNPLSTSLSIVQGNLYIGGIYQVAADAAYPVGTFVYWDPVGSQITTGKAGTVPFGWIVAGPTGLASDGGPTGAASLCFVLHQPNASSTTPYNLGAVANDNITNTASETAFATTAVIPAATLVAGDIISIRAAVVVTAQNSTNTNTIKLKILTATNTFTAIVNTGAINAAANAIALIDVDLLFNAVGNTGGFTTVGEDAFGAPGTATMSPVYLANTAINTNAAVTIEVTDTQSAGSTGNVTQLLELNVTLKRK